MRAPRSSRLATVAALAALSGCGGSSGGDSSASGGGHEFSVRADTTLTVASTVGKEKFIARVNDLCRRRWRPVLNAVRQTSRTDQEDPTASKHERFIRAIKLSYFASLDFLIFDEIHRMGVPAGQKKAVEEVIGAMQEGVERGQREAKIASVADVKPLFADYNRKARAYGLDECVITAARLPRPEA